MFSESWSSFIGHKRLVLWDRSPDAQRIQLQGNAYPLMKIKKQFNFFFILKAKTDGHI
jgi:hypothetical protein